MRLVEMSVYGGVMILVVLGLRMLFLQHLPKKTFLILWGIVLVRLLIPFEIASPLSIYNLIPQELRLVEQTQEEQQTGWKQETQEEQQTGQTEQTLQVQQTGQVQPEQQSGKTDESKMMLKDSQVQKNIFWKALYVAGVLVCLGFYAISYGRSLRRFKMAVPVTGVEVDAWLAEHRCVRNIRIQKTGAIHTPLTYGIRKPVILLPETFDVTDKPTAEYVLEHEYTHIRRFDLLYKQLMVAAVCIHWWNPLVWVMLCFLNRDIELSCDECVVRHFGTEEKKAYAMALLCMEERRAGGETLCSGFSKNPNEERILEVLRMKRQSRKAVVAMFLIAAVFGTIFATSAASVYAKPQEKNLEQDIECVSKIRAGQDSSGVQKLAADGKDDSYGENLWAYENDDKSSSYCIHVYYRLSVMELTTQGFENVTDEEAMSDTMKEAMQGTMEAIGKFWDSQNFESLTEMGAEEVRARLQEVADAYSTGKDVISVEKVVYAADTRELEQYLNAVSQCSGIY